MLIDANENGYYALPRGTSTKELAESFGISDQAVTERLRRGISNLLTNTLLLTADGDD
jgi:predicted DNA binding protein